MDGQGVGLSWTRPSAPSYEFNVLAVDRVADQCIVGRKSRGAGSSHVAPLYTSRTRTRNQTIHADLLDGSASEGDRPLVSNLRADFAETLAGRIGLHLLDVGKGDLVDTVGPEDIFNYLYAALSAPSYAERYAEHLKLDLCRVPLTSDAELFSALAAFGEELVALHTLRHPALTASSHRPQFPASGTNVVESRDLSFVPTGGSSVSAPSVITGDVVINQGPGGASQAFRGITQDAWEFELGGYPILRHWLEQRRGQSLGYAALNEFGTVVAAVSETQRVLGEIDDAIERSGGWPLK